MEWITDKRIGTQTGLLFSWLVVLNIICLIVMIHPTDRATHLFHGPVDRSQHCL